MDGPRLSPIDFVPKPVDRDEKPKACVARLMQTSQKSLPENGATDSEIALSKLQLLFCDYGEQHLVS